MTNRSLLFLAIVTTFYSLAGATTGVFLPNYLLQVGLSVNQIVLLMGLVVVILGLAPILTLKFLPKSFEKLLTVGLLLNILFYGLLITIKNPLVLGLALGFSWTTFWPAYNLLMFRLTSIKGRGLIVSAIYVAIPAATGITGPFIGGTFIRFFGFSQLFILGMILLSIAVIFSLKIDYKPTNGFAIPKNRLLLVFGMIIAIGAFTDPVSWISYPLFLHKLSGSFFNMGIIASAIAAVFAIVSLVANKVSHTEKHRINFAILGYASIAIWVVALSLVQNVFQLIGVSVFSGIAGAFTIMSFVLFGDFFKRKQHASLVVLWELFLMFGRITNLIPTSIFISGFNFKSYFLITGLIGLTAIIPLVLLKLLHIKGTIAVDKAQNR